MFKIALSMTFLAFVFQNATAALPVQLDKVCNQALNYSQETGTILNVNPPVFSEKYLIYNKSENDLSVVENYEGRAIFESSYTLNAIKEVTDGLWLATLYDLMKIDFKGVVVQKLEYNSSGSYSSQILDVVSLDQMIIVNRGRAGLFAYDSQSLKLVWQNNLSDVLNGQLVAMTHDGYTLYLAFNNSAESGFTGVAQYDARTGHFIKATPYDQTRGIVGLDVKARFHNGKLYLNNEGWIHVLTKDQLLKDKKLRPRWIANVVAQNGEINQHYMMSIGDFLFEGNELVSCGKYVDLENGMFTIKSKTFKTKF